MNRIEFAREFATRAHGDQKYGDSPYLVHLVEVGVVLSLGMFSPPDHLVEASFLHDVLEDTPVPYGTLELLFPKAAPLVEKVTGRGPNRKARNESVYAKLAGDPLAQSLKAADRIANMTASLRLGDPGKQKMYLREFPEFFAAIPLADSGLREKLGGLYEKMKAGK